MEGVARANAGAWDRVKHTLLVLSPLVQDLPARVAVPSTVPDIDLMKETH